MDIQWDAAQGEEFNIGNEDFAQHAAAYREAVAADEEQNHAQRDRELKAIESAAGQYGPKIETALAAEDPEQLNALKQELSELVERPIERPEDDQLHERLQALDARYEAFAKSALAKAAIDVDAIRQEIVDAIGVKLPGHVALLGGPTIPFAIALIVTAPPQPPPSQLQLRTPYGLWAISDTNAGADRQSGRFYANATATVASSSAVKASIGSLFDIHSDVRSVRVDTQVDVTYCSIWAFGLGYASAEAILNLRLLDGTRELSNDRLSLARVIAPGLWAAEARPNGSFTMSCEIHRSRGASARYAAIAEVESWAGAGGASGALSMLSADLIGIDVSFT